MWATRSPIPTTCLERRITERGFLRLGRRPITRLIVPPRSEYPNARLGTGGLIVVAEDSRDQAAEACARTC
jgi:hypothetical protein